MGDSKSNADGDSSGVLSDNGREVATARETSLVLTLLGEFRLEEQRQRNRRLRQHIIEQNALDNSHHSRG